MKQHCGFVAIVGRPNVGKSTILNKILGQKISITSRRPQTTRHKILGVKTQDSTQTIYIDTPGIHKSGGKAINQYMNRTASQSVFDVDLVLFVVEGTRWTNEDDIALKKVQASSAPCILVVNKVDKVEDKSALLAHLKTLGEKHQFQHLVPISAKKDKDLVHLEKLIEENLPESGFYFSDDQITDKSIRFLASEIIREKLTRMLGQELPYHLTVEIEEFKEEENLIRVGAIIWVERPGQKAIVIGKQGEKLKQVGSLARVDMEKLFFNKVFLRLFVRVKENWSDDIRALKSLGYTDDD